MASSVLAERWLRSSSCGLAMPLAAFATSKLPVCSVSLEELSKVEQLALGTLSLNHVRQCGRADIRPYSRIFQAGRFIMGMCVGAMVTVCPMVSRTKEYPGTKLTVVSISPRWLIRLHVAGWLVTTPSSWCLDTCLRVGLDSLSTLLLLSSAGDSRSASRSCRR